MYRFHSQTSWTSVSSSCSFILIIANMCAGFYGYATGTQYIFFSFKLISIFLIFWWINFKFHDKIQCTNLYVSLIKQYCEVVCRCVLYQLTGNAFRHMQRNLQSENATCKGWEIAAIIAIVSLELSHSAHAAYAIVVNNMFTHFARLLINFWSKNFDYS